jgi:hypothetical protein
VGCLREDCNGVGKVGKGLRVIGLDWILRGGTDWKGFGEGRGDLVLDGDGMGGWEEWVCWW